MSEAIKNLVDAMISKDASSMENSFQAAMAEKISARLDDMRQDIAQNMFKSAEDETIEEPTVETEAE